MSLGTSNRDGGKTSESGHLRALAKIVSGDVITGLNAVQRAAGVNMSVDIQVGDAFVRRSDGTYAHPVFNDAVYNQVISAADGSNPRRDIVVIYVDYGQTPSTTVSNNTNGVVKIKVVNGTPAGSPVDPNGAAIQASVGSGNPYSILARIRVPAGQTSISNSLIDDLRTMITNNANTINTASLQASAVKAANIDFTTFPKFLAYANASTTLVAAVNTKVLFATEEYDPENIFASSRLTATIPGYYLLNSTVGVTAGGSNENYAITFYKNGTEYKRGNHVITGGTGDFCISVSPPPIYLAVNDYIEVFIYNSTAGNKTTSPGQAVSYFGGVMVAP